MKFVKIRKAWLITQFTFVMLTVFFSLFIPAMCLNFKLLYIIVGTGSYLNEGLFVFVMIAFGLLFISLVVASCITLYFNDNICRWDEQFKLLRLR